MDTLPESTTLEYLSTAATLLGPFLFMYWRNGALLGREPFANPYKWGFYLGYSYLISSIFGLLEYRDFNPLQMAWTIDEIWNAGFLVTNLVVAIGLNLRLKIGWQIYFLYLIILPLIVAWEYFGNDDIEAAFEGISWGFPAFIVGLYLSFVIMNVIYARVRWEEFRPKSVEND